MLAGPWSGHTRFAYDLVRFMQPANIAELGTFMGTSYFSMCQAVRDGGLSTRCYAVDTWQGDPHQGYYQDDVFQRVATVNQREYAPFSTLIRNTFDAALPSFPDGSISLLHIDGYHTYEASLHDYTAWYPKVAHNGIVLFHDIAVREKDFGVYRLWAELSSAYPHLTFLHSNGLGVLFPKGCPQQFQPILANKEAFIRQYQY
nr:class I SAM-dependent methyltransferase [Paenibacillus xerothermodurans]